MGAMVAPCISFGCCTEKTAGARWQFGEIRQPCGFAASWCRWQTGSRPGANRGQGSVYEIVKFIHSFIPIEPRPSSLKRCSLPAGRLVSAAAAAMACPACPRGLCSGVCCTRMHIGGNERVRAFRWRRLHRPGYASVHKDRSSACQNPRPQRCMCETWR